MKFPVLSLLLLDSGNLLAEEPWRGSSMRLGQRWGVQRPEMPTAKGDFGAQD